MANLTFNIDLNIRRFERNINRMQRSFENVAGTTERVARSSAKIGDAADRNAKQQDNFNKKLDKTSSLFTSILKSARRLAATYLGKMGLDALLETMDSLISTQNKLNYLNGQRLGEAGVNASGTGYSQLTKTATAQDMDKIFNAANQSRMGYLDMADNVAKSLTLAGDAFDGNINKAIKFQKIMSEAYTIGGASEQQKSSSMYQLIQALGSGRLQGDELRSVAEGAQIAYHEIEKYAQALYGTTDSMKEMGSKGMLTSKVVVDAIMGIEDEIDSAFQKTEKTFGQMKTMVKNESVRAFEPVMKRLADFLNSDNGQKMAKILVDLIYKLASVTDFLLDKVIKLINFVLDHQEPIAKGLRLLSPLIGVGLVGAMVKLHSILFKVIGGFSLFGVKISTLTSPIQALGKGIGRLAVAGIGAEGALGAVVASLGVVGIAIAGIVAVCAIFSDSLEDFVGMLFGYFAAIGAGIYDVVAIAGKLIVSFGIMLRDVAKFVAMFIKDTFLNAIYIVEDAFKGLASVAGNILLKIANGLNSIGIGVSTEGLENFTKKMSQTHELQFNATSAFKNTNNDLDKWMNSKAFKVIDPEDVYKKYYNKGYNIFGSGKSSDNILGTATGSLDDYVSNAFDGLNGNGTDATDPTDKAIKDTADNTGDIANTLNNATQDLTYLRKLAELEWKRDYTNYNIEIEMTNNNNISKEADVESITNALATKLNEVAGSSVAGAHY